MDKEKLVKMAKQDMTNIVEDLTVENIDNFIKKMNYYFDYLRAIPFLNDNIVSEETTAEPIISNEMEVIDEPVIEYEQPILEQEEIIIHNEALPERNSTPNQVENDGEAIYLFERKLSGGFVSALQSVVPEEIVRRLELENGDYVKAKPNYNNESEMKRYYYQLAKKGEGKPSENRSEFNYCLVEKDGNTLVVNESLLDGGAVVKFNEITHTFVLRNEDIIRLGIEEGDIIDIAYQTNDPSYYKVIWKHSIDNEDYQSPKISGYYKMKTKTDNIAVKKIFKDKKILVIGCSPRKAVFKASIENRGGEFFWSNGLEGVADLSLLVKKMDAVVILTRFIRHRASIDTVAVCKELNVPFAVAKNLGIQTLLTKAENALNGKGDN